MRGINEHNKWSRCKELTAVIRFTSTKLALLEELPNAPHGICGSELLKHLDNAQCLRLRLLKPMLSMLKVSLQPHRASQDVRVVTIGRV